MNIIQKLLKNKLVRNFIVLISGDAFVSVLNIISTAVIINAIGLDKNGMILMIQTYALFFDQTFNFKSFQALIKYLSITLNQNDSEKTKFYIKQSFVFDLSSATIATITAFICINVAINIMGWNEALKPYLMIYIITIIFNLSGTCIGILRIFGNYNYITYINMCSAIFRILLFVVGFILKLNFTFFFSVEMFYTIIKSLLYMFFSYKTLYANNLQDFYKTRIKFNKAFFMFNLYSNLTSTIDLPVGTLTTFIINKYLGFEMISVYKIFEKIGSLLGRLSEPLNQIIYPELNNLVSKDNKHGALKMVKKLVLGIGGGGAVVIAGVFFTHKLWLGIFIENYEIYIGSLMLYMIFIIFVNVTSSIHSLFLALGYVKYSVPIVLIINIVYCIIIIPIVRSYMLNGVILALFIQSILVILSKLFVMKYVKLEKVF